ncbi:hypothetical protein CAEBREN_31931 [Caenorhabditis brenneri]|uniref:Poly [ADP-ribose] polymerase n=1 Tax=Caenorhabditis brenneri TaxID=135651 RepID=G0P0X2_CAEBE|nr:hypothetical protein CAEBREN_31931 [Caenorhabditis brenneri]
MSVNHQASFFDGNIDSWFHYPCFWLKLIKGQDEINISSIRGVDWLRWEDQEDLREQIKKFKEPYVYVPRTSSINALSLSEMKAERSATNRGKCTKCSINFIKGEIKVNHKSKAFHFKCHLEDFDNVTETLEQIRGWADFDDCWKVNATNDLAAFIESKKSANEPQQPDNDAGTSVNVEEALETCAINSNSQFQVPPTTTSEDDQQIEPVKTVSFDDQPSSSSGKKRLAIDEIVKLDEDGSSEESDFNRKRRLGKEARLAEVQKRRLKRQADNLLQNYKLFSDMSSSDRLAILSENNQDLPEGHDQSTQVLERLSDYAVYGCPIDCQKCPNGKIVYNSSRRTYVCTGYATEYSKCAFESKNPIRTPFIMPKRMYTKYDMKGIVFNVLSERIYLEGEEEEIVRSNKRQSKGGVFDNQFFYAAEQMDALHRGSGTASSSDAASNTHIIKNGTLVDAKFSLASQCHVFKNETDGSLYQATLSFTDLTQNKNSYYKMQLLKNDHSDNYYLFRSWGRVGTEVGDSMFERFHKEAAINEFQKIFHEKTSNEWVYRKHFRKIAGKFNYVETDYSEIAELGDQDVIPGSKTLLPKSVKEVVMSIFDVENMKSALKSFEMDINKMPLGRLSRNQINQAFAVLNDVSELLTEMPINTGKLLDASNKFYTIIPHNFGMKVPEPIDSFHKVKEKNNMLNALLDIKFAYDQICGDNPTAGVIGVDPVDTNYQKLKCAMAPLERGSQDWKMIEEYFKNTRGSTHDMKVDLVDVGCRDILKLNKENESAKFKAGLGNRRLLWHGSGKMNFAGILGQGLRIAPPEAPVSGYMFGKGVYFADMFSKSFFYCRAGAKEEAYLLLCDVALGTSQVCYRATTFTQKTLPKQTHSVHVGFFFKTCSISHCFRFIVYDVDQIQLKYLVRVKMHHARHL